jgi:hypothetical protein
MLKKLVLKVLEDYDYYKMDCELAKDYCHQPIPKFMILSYVKDRFKWHTSEVVCKLLGHDWVDESYGNSESGVISMYCSRCGESHRTVLY